MKDKIKEILEGFSLDILSAKPNITDAEKEAIYKKRVKQIDDLHQKEIDEIRQAIYMLIGHYFGFDSNLEKAEQALRDISSALKEKSNV